MSVRGEDQQSARGPLYMLLVGILVTFIPEILTYLAPCGWNGACHVERSFLVFPIRIVGLLVILGSVFGAVNVWRASATVARSSVSFAARTKYGRSLKKAVGYRAQRR